MDNFDPRVAGGLSRMSYCLDFCLLKRSRTHKSLLKAKHSLNECKSFTAFYNMPELYPFCLFFFRSVVCGSHLELNWHQKWICLVGFEILYFADQHMTKNVQKWAKALLAFTFQQRAMKTSVRCCEMLIGSQSVCWSKANPLNT